MKLATLRLEDGTRAVRIDGDAAVECGHNDVGGLLQAPDWKSIAEAAHGPAHRLSTASFAPVITRPGKILCVGLNYRSHILEMGRELPTYPTLFAKYPEALLGPYDDLELPDESDAVDWEAELAVVIGRPVRRANAVEANDAIAGYSILNDVTMRDWQFRTKEWLQGKTFEATAPFGPVLVTPEELPSGAEITCLLDGEEVQRGSIDDLVFNPVELVQYISTILTLNPGDVIISGTTGGVGHARRPPRYLQPGQTLVTRIAGLGELRNMTRSPVGAALP